jgi:WD40 repeat protein
MATGRVVPLLVAALAFLFSRHARAADPRDPSPPDKPPARVDLYGDPMPDGAVARFGTARLRGLSASVCFSPDGKTLVGVDGGRLIRVWDAATGKLLSTRHLAQAKLLDHWANYGARSADGRTVVVHDRKDLLEMWDIPSGKRVDVPLPRGRKRFDSLAVSDDRRWLILCETVEDKFDTKGGGGGFGQLAHKQNLLLWDTTTGKLRVLAADEELIPHLVAGHVVVSRDGKRLASSTTGKGTCVWDADTGKRLWHGEATRGALAFSPDGKSLFVDTGARVLDADSGKLSSTLHGHPFGGPAWSLTVSPDGSKLVVPTDVDFVLWDLRAGEVLHRWPGAHQSGTAFFAPDGKSVVTCTSVLQRWDVDTGKPLYADVASLGHTAQVKRLLATPDGKRLASLGDDRTMRIWDTSTSKPLHVLDGGARAIDGWAFTPDGKVLLTIDDQLTVRRWSVADGKLLSGRELREATSLDIGLRAYQVRVLADGKTLAVSAWPRAAEYQFYKYSFSFWDLETGRLLRWGGAPDHRLYYNGANAGLSPDARLASVEGKLFDTATGRLWLELRMGAKEFAGKGAVFSANGQLLAADLAETVDVEPFVTTARSKEVIRVWETATGQPVVELQGVATYRSAFSPDGRWFASTNWERLAVCDVRTGEVALERPTPEQFLGQREPGFAADIAFSPDGRTVYTGHPDGTILAWTLPTPKGNSLNRERDGDVLWRDLVQADARRAHAAAWQLRDDHAAAVRLIKARLRPVPRLSDDEIAALLRDLDSEQFETREAATNRLRHVGRGAEDALRRALKGTPSPEQKRQLDALIAALEPTSPPGADEVGTLRALAVLEGIATPESREILQALADGLPGVTLTDEARQALRRVDNRLSSPK